MKSSILIQKFSNSSTEGGGGEEKGDVQVSYYDYLETTQSVANGIGIYSNQFANTYAEFYDDAIRQGMSPFEARRSTLESLARANEEYASINASKAAVEGNSFKQNIYKNLAESYGAQADSLSSDIIKNEADLNRYVDSMRDLTTSKVGKLASSKAGKALLKSLGPVSDAYN